MHHQQPYNPYANQQSQFPSKQAMYPPTYMQQNASQLSENSQLPTEESYVENILRLNRGKIATVHMTFENGDESNKRIFEGRIEAAGRDHIVLSDPETEKRYLLLMVYLDYVTFDEKIDYSYPFNSSEQLTSYQPR